MSTEVLTDYCARLQIRNFTLHRALEEIRDQDPVENALDPQWAGRIAKAAIGQGYRDFFLLTAVTNEDEPRDVTIGVFATREDAQQAISRVKDLVWNARTIHEFKRYRDFEIEPIKVGELLVGT